MYRKRTTVKNGVTLYILQKGIRKGFDLFFFIIPYYSWEEVYRSSKESDVDSQYITLNGDDED